jgi:hypothetical protein
MKGCKNKKAHLRKWALVAFAGMFETYGLVCKPAKTTAHEVATTHATDVRPLCTENQHTLRLVRQAPAVKRQRIRARLKSVPTALEPA